MTGMADSAAAPKPHVSPFNVANALTVLRLVLVPAFLIALFTGPDDTWGWRLAAAMLFWIAAVTDRFDGWVARKYDLETKFGKVADPIADKALVGSALVALSILGELWWWVTAVIILREGGVTLLRFFVRKRGMIPSSRGGKTKTFFQALAIWMYLMPFPDWVHPISLAAMMIAVVLTVATGIDYLVQASRMRAGDRPATTGQGHAARDGDDG